MMSLRSNALAAVLCFLAGLGITEGASPPDPSELLTRSYRGASIDGRYFAFTESFASSESFATAVDTKTLVGSSDPCCCWCLAGGFAGGTAGFFAYAPRALTDARRNVSDGQRFVEWSLVTAGSALLGYWIVKAIVSD